jgi:hypothetical protein
MAQEKVTIEVTFELEGVSRDVVIARLKQQIPSVLQDTRSGLPTGIKKVEVKVLSEQ